MSLSAGDELLGGIDSLQERAQAYVLKYSRLSCSADLDIGVDLYREALSKEINNVGSGTSDGLIAELCEALCIRFRDWDDEADIHEAILLGEHICSRTSPDHAESLRFLRIFGQSLALLADTRQMTSGGARGEAIGYLRQVYDLTTHLTSNEAILCLCEYGDALSIPFGSKQSEERKRDLQLALPILDKAIQLTPRGHELRARSLLSRALLGWWFDRIMPGVCDLGEAIGMAEESTSLTPLGHCLRPNAFNKLGVLYERKYQKDADPHLLDSSLESFREASRDLSPNHALWFTVHGNLNEMFLIRHIARSNVEDLEASRQGLKDVLEMMPKTHDQYPYYTSMLGRALDYSYAYHGKAMFLDEAIALHKKASQEASQEDRSGCLKSYAQAHHTRFLAHRDPWDLEEAIRLLHEADQCCNQERARPETVAVLGDCLATYAALNDDQSDLETAIDRYQWCLTSAPHHNTKAFSMAHYHSSLGDAFLQRYGTSKSQEDLLTAISNQQAASNLLQPRHIFIPTVCYKLGSAKMTYYRLTRDLLDIREAIAAFENAVNLTHAGLSSRARYLARLGEARYELYSTTQDIADLTAARAALREGARDKFSFVANRLYAARAWANIAHTVHDLEDAWTGYQVAIKLLPQVALLRLDNTERLQDLTRRFPTLSQDAAACAIALDKPEDAVEVLDHGRAVIWNASQRLRSDLSELRGVDPDLADRFHEISAALNFLALRTERLPESDTASDGELHRKLVQQWDDALEKIRTCDGFGDFLKPQSYAELRKAATGGVVIVVNVSKYNSHALLFREEEKEREKGLYVIPLPELKPQLLQEQAKSLQEEGTKGHQHFERKLLEVLRSLWHALGIHVWSRICTFLSTNLIPRVWWCPTGDLAYLPVHACGPDATGTKGLADLVISSYIPTPSALLRARASRSVATAAPVSHMLAIGLPTTPGLADSDLPFVPAEMEILKNLLGRSHLTLLKGPDATKDRVKKTMSEHSWLHVSAHAMLQPDSFESCIHLWDGRLTLSDIARTRFPHGEVAFLSVCYSAKAGPWWPNESLHLSGAILTAGFKGVVGTLWCMADEDGPDVTQLFYNGLRQGEEEPNASKAAEALHHATLALRERKVEAWRWASLIHLGA